MRTPKPLFAFVALLLSYVGTSAASAASGPLYLVLAADTVAQAKPKTASEREQAEELMLQARQAIKDGNLETADSLISRAEKFKIEYSVFHLGDTPKKLRADLAAAQKNAKPLTKPSQKFTPEMPAQPAARATDPARATTGAVPSEIRNIDQIAPMAMPQSDGRISPLNPYTRGGSTPDEAAQVQTRMPPATREQPQGASNSPAARQQSDVMLLTARRALADGDVKRAAAAVDSARQLGVAYDHQDDSPDRIEAAIRKYQQVAPGGSGPEASEAARRLLADVLLDQAQQLLKWQEYDEAERLVRHAQGLRVQFGAFEARPDTMLEKIAAARRGGARDPRQAYEDLSQSVSSPRGEGGEHVTSEMSNPLDRYPAQRAVYDREPGRPSGADNRLTSGDDGEPFGSPERLPVPAPVRGPNLMRGDTSALQFYQLGEQALREQDSAQALEFFRQAYTLRSQLDQPTLQRLQEQIQLLSPQSGAARASDRPGTLIDSATNNQQVLVKQLNSETQQKQIEAGKIKEKDPKRAMEILKSARANIEASQVDAESRGVLLRRVDRSITDLDKYISENRSDIEANAANKDVLREVDRRRKNQDEVDGKLEKLFNDYNKLMDEQRYAEAEVVVKRATELDPDNPAVRQLKRMNSMVNRISRNSNLRDQKEKMTWEELNNVEKSAVAFNSDQPYQFPDTHNWQDLTTRRGRNSDMGPRRTERELEIERKLSTPVSLQFRNRPLNEVLDHMAKLAAVNLHLDPKGLDEEGVLPDTPVTIELRHDISLKSALNLILQPLHLSFVVKDEVLKITSEQLRDGEVVRKTYLVADLIIPIPNFPPNSRMGLAGALGDAYAMAGSAGMGAGTNGMYLASHEMPSGNGMASADVLAQQVGAATGGPRVSTSSPGSHGPGGIGHGNQADFDALIDLITTTVRPTTWAEVGGPGSVVGYRGNMSLVISQTQDVHEEIADLLMQLRRNQDLQVTIEVRFITLNDNFFERIGVDFQANIVTDPQSQILNANGTLAAGVKNEIVGIDTQGGNAPSGNTPNFAPNFAIPFRQSSFNLASPQFGQPADVARFGFAILSDLEAFLLVNAAQGDRRSNVLQAPKVTLFNGQQASVSDQTQTPFVTSVVPVVGEFAAAYQPVITVLSEGTFLSVQAVVSSDRRFVRLTVIPFFSQIGEVREFTFSGSKSTTSKSSGSTSKGGIQGDTDSDAEDVTTSSEGITIQLPNFSSVSVATTVSVPDGGTVLLGGIKRLSEGRNEFGVPILSKLPYINRLFKNVGIGRETQSLMMMVTPRIIIQEEEEEKMGIVTPP